MGCSVSDLVPLNGHGSENRNLAGRFPPGVSGNPGGRPKGLRSMIREQTGDGAELVAFALAVLRGKRRAMMKQRLEALYWLADRGFGKAAITLPDLPPGVESLTIREIVVERNDGADDGA